MGSSCEIQVRQGCPLHHTFTYLQEDLLSDLCVQMTETYFFRQLLILRQM